jgi:hypothetical protein
LPPSFQPAAAAPPPRTAKVTFDLDADVAEWFGPGLQRELNDLARFYMETSLIREQVYKDVFAQPEHEIQVEGPAPARNASKIDFEFIPP